MIESYKTNPDCMSGIEIGPLIQHTGFTSTDVLLSQSRINKYMFCSTRLSIVPSFLARQPNPNLIKNFFGIVFGLNNPERAGPGVVMDSTDLHHLVEYISLSCVNKEFKDGDGYFMDKDLDNEILRLEVLDHGKKRFMVTTFRAVMKLYNEHSWLNDECLDLFTDSLNLFNGEYASSVCLSMMPASKLYSLSSVYSTGPTLDVNDEEFSTKLQKLIINGSMRSGLPYLREEYVAKRKELRKVMGIVHVESSHFIAFVVNFNERAVHTYDPYGKASNMQVHEVRTEEVKDLYSNDDMQGHELKVDKDSTSFSHHHLSSDTILLKKQIDGWNYGIHCLWFLLWQIDLKQNMTELHLGQFRKQILLYVTGLQIYFDYIEDDDFKFTTETNIVDLMCRECLDYSNKWLRDIFVRNNMFSKNDASSEDKNQHRRITTFLQKLKISIEG